MGGFSVGDWGHVPPGCVMWGSTVHFNKKATASKTCHERSECKFEICTEISNLQSYRMTGIGNAIIVVDGSNLKITSKSTGSSSTIAIKADSGTNAKALFGSGVSVP